MPPVALRQLLEAGVHFGHQTSRWNPKMRPYIFTERNGIHIVDLEQTQVLLEEARKAIRDLVATGQKILFVGTKKQAQDAIEAACQATGQYYVTHRWMGGMLTNFSVIQRRLKTLSDLRVMRERGDFERMGTKEANSYRDTLDRLERNFGGMAEMKRLPGALVIIDCKKERLAVNEANKLNIPIIALTDTNCDPDTATWVIPGNDDAIRAVRLVIETLTEGIREGQQLLSERELRERQEATARAALEQATMEAAAAEEASPAVASETGPSAEEAKAEAERTAPEAAAHA